MAPLTDTHTPGDPPMATRIVGIGASAGGLAPLEEFLTNVPPRSHLAYLVVQHMDPTHKGMLPELLQRVTSMPVHEVRENMRIEADSVYVIPPNSELTVANGALHVNRPSEPRGMRLPINVLFSSLASNQGERAIAVVLSGMGADGTLGLQAIKAVGGLTVAQRPDSAQFDAMPISAISAGCVDIVGTPAELPERILAYVAQVRDPGDDTASLIEAAPLQRILDALHQRTRHNFSLYKSSTLHRRIERRMAIHNLATQALYADLLAKNPQEVDLLFKELLIGVTSFFRDPAVWDFLADTVLPELLARCPADHKLRAWIVGCSTGEEAYSLAMVFSEVVHRLPNFRGMSLQIFASDLSQDAIASARRGRYSAEACASVSADRLARFFSAHDGAYEINQDIRDMVLFAQHDVVLDPPFTKLDLISCRNLLIYFDASLQRRLIPLFHYSLHPGGVLLLGSSETIGRFNHLFSPAQSKLRFYLRKETGAGAGFLMHSIPPLSRKNKEPTVSPPTHSPPPTDTLQAAADQVLLQVYAPAAVVINGDADIVYISGRTGKYLEPAAGKANLNFHAMVRPELRSPIAAALKQAATQREPLQLHDLITQLPGGGAQRVDVTVQALQEPIELHGLFMIIFRDVELIPPGQSRRKRKTKTAVARNAAQQQYQDELQTLREEARASREQLQSANEELQSTNEELTTSKEEMQSMNEELQTINAELQSKLDDLSLAQSDLKNLLNSVEIAILFLDRNLNVRRFTDRAAKIINVRESDIGRPLSDLTTSLQYPELHEDAQETLRTLVISEKQVVTNTDEWFEVRILPYRRLDNVIDGVVITFVNITESKKLEAKLRKDAN